VHHSDCYNPAPAGQVRRGRAIFQFGFEHGVWAARDCDIVGQDYDWRRGWFLPAGVVSLAAGNHGHELGSAIRLAGTDTASLARIDTSSIADACGARGPTNIDGSDACVAAAVKEEIAPALKANVRQTSARRASTTDKRSSDIKHPSRTSRSGGIGRRARLRGV
jgi:hypothetical protein